jgi:hypothetical protein
MRAVLHHYLSDHSGHHLSVEPDANCDRVPDANDQRMCGRSVQQLVWILISILLLSYLAASYLLWAKLESAWPIFRGFH